MRKREFLRKIRERERLQKLNEAGKVQVEKQLKGSVFKVFRMLALHQIFESIFNSKK